MLAVTRTFGSSFGLSCALLMAAPVWAQQPIRIGATMLESGNLATQGGPAGNGYRLCQKGVNEAAVSNTTVEPALAVTRAKRDYQPPPFPF
jgi:hypothetical protein